MSDRWVMTCDGPDLATATCALEQPDLLIYSGAELSWADVSLFVAACWGLLALAYGARVVTRLINPRL